MRKDLATLHQDNAYTSFPLHGLWKIADDRVITPTIYLSAKYGYYNTGFSLTPEGGVDQQAGRDFTTAQSFGSTSEPERAASFARATVVEIEDHVVAASATS